MLKLPPPLLTLSGIALDMSNAAAVCFVARRMSDNASRDPFDFMSTKWLTVLLSRSSTLSGSFTSSLSHSFVVVVAVTMVIWKNGVPAADAQ